MAHVYHLKRADYRVPRWFTEGLAEFETNVRRDAWVRHHDRAIAHALRHDDIPSIVDLNTQFSQAKSYRDILQAYHLSSLVIHFIHQTWGFDGVNDMLAAYPKRLKTARVIEEVFELEVSGFDRQFRDWLRAKYNRFDNQLLIRPSTFPSAAKLQAEPSSERDAEWYAHHAWRLAERRKTDKAKAAIQKALERAEHAPVVRFVAMLLARQRGELDAAYDHGMAILSQSSDDYTLRVVLGEITRQLERPEEALIHLRAATELYPDGARAWQSIRQLAEARGKQSLRARAVERLFELDQTSASAARAYVQLNRKRGEWRLAKRAADRWIAIQPFEARAHRARTEAAMRVGAADDALQSWLALAAIRPDGDATTAILEEGKRRLEQAGMAPQAAALEQRLNRRNSP
jgi:tetratricopeptide (TPR) repeat protein